MVATSTFVRFDEHNVNPIVEVSQAVPITHRTTQWRDSIVSRYLKAKPLPPAV